MSAERKVAIVTGASQGIGAGIAARFGAAGASATNHYLDRDLDSVMRRTQNRPLPAHRIEPPAHVLAFGLALVVAGLVIAGVELKEGERTLVYTRRLDLPQRDFNTSQEYEAVRSLFGDLEKIDAQTLLLVHR